MTHSDVPLLSDAEHVSNAVWDVPADFFNSISGTGENLGWFGTLDEELDLRVLFGDMETDEFVDPSTEEGQEATAFDALSQQSGFVVTSTAETAGDAAGDVATGFFDVVLDNPVLLAITVLVVIYVVGQLFDVDVGGIVG